MAIIQNRHCGESILLRSHHIFGRAKTKTDTYIDDSTISLVHASLRWSGKYWELIDHSRNGTWLNGEQLTRIVKLKVGDKIAFKHGDGQAWIFSDDTPPQTMLLGLTPRAGNINLDAIHTLPNEEEPQLFLYKPKNGNWVFVESNVEKKLVDGDIITIGPELRWRFQLAEPTNETANNDMLQEQLIETSIFEFRVSADEEHTWLKLTYNNTVVDFCDRVHHYLLLTLARKKVADLQAGHKEHVAGWVEMSELQKMLGLDYQHINIQIHRARQLINRKLGIDFSDTGLIERRFGGVRLGGKNYRIVQAGKIEFDYLADSCPCLDDSNNSINYEQ